MADDKLQAITTKLDGTNYSYWSHVMKNFIMGKGMWNYVIGMTIRPVESQETEADVAQILTWFHNPVQTTTCMNFSKYSTSKQVWDYLKTMYLESNFAKQYELEMSIRSASQKDKSIQEFYNEMTTYWDQLAVRGVNLSPLN